MLAPLRAVATTYESKVNAESGLYWCAHSQAFCETKLGTLTAGTPVHMECWEDGRYTSNPNLPRWFYVLVNDGREGFVKAERIPPAGSPGGQISTPNCGTVGPKIAARWAILHLVDKGYTSYTQATLANNKFPKTSERTTMQNLFGFTNWGSKYDWSGDCISFGALGWSSGGTKIRFGNAYAVYQSYNSTKALPTSAKPPRGALVFWDYWYGGVRYGHVAIALGNGMTVGTQGMDGDVLPVTTYTVTGKGLPYLGWVLPNTSPWG